MSRSRSKNCSCPLLASRHLNPVSKNGPVCKAYELISRPAISGIIRCINAELYDREISENLRFPQQQVARGRSLGNTSSVKLTFYGKDIPDYVLLGHVRHPVFPYHDCPVVPVAVMARMQSSNPLSFVM